MEINTFEELQTVLLIIPKNEVFTDINLNLGLEKCLVVIISDYIIPFLKDSILSALKTRQDINLITHKQYGKFYIIVNQVKPIDVNNILTVTRGYGGIKLDFNEETNVLRIN